MTDDYTDPALAAADPTEGAQSDGGFWRRSAIMAPFSIIPKAARAAVGVAGMAAGAAFYAGSAAGSAGRVAYVEGYACGVATHARAEIALGLAMIHVARIAIHGKGAANRLASRALSKVRADAPPGPLTEKAKAAADFGASLAIEGFPLWMAIATLVSSRAASFSPADTSPLNSSGLPFEHALHLAGESSVSDASLRLSQIKSWRLARRSPRSDTVLAAEPARARQALHAEAPPEPAAPPRRLKL